MPPKSAPHPRPFRRIPLTPAENETRKDIRSFREAEEKLKRDTEKEAKLIQKLEELEAQTEDVNDQFTNNQAELIKARDELTQSVHALKLYSRVAVTNPRELKAVGDVLYAIGGWNLTQVSIKADPKKAKELNEMESEAEDWARDEEISLPEFRVD